MAEIKTPYGTVVGLILDPQETESEKPSEKIFDKPKRPTRKAKTEE